MKKKLLTTTLISLLSVSILIGCSKFNSNKNSNSLNNKNKNTATDNVDNKSDIEKDSWNTDESINSEDKIKNKFQEAINTIYNFDYSKSENKISLEPYIKSNFTPEGTQNTINKIISYKEKVSSSDLLITLIKEIPNTDDRYVSMYEVRYNVNITFAKTSVYTDLISTIFVDKEGNIKIESLNNNNF